MATETAPPTSAQGHAARARQPALLPTERVSRETVTFATPFFVEGAGRQCGAGTFEIETLEELIEGLSFPAYRAVSTSIVLPLSTGSSQSYELARIDPAIVRAARATGGRSESHSAGERAGGTP